jgi:hypothetical protein
MPRTANPIRNDEPAATHCDQLHGLRSVARLRIEHADLASNRATPYSDVFTTKACVWSNRCRARARWHCCTATPAAPPRSGQQLPEFPRRPGGRDRLRGRPSAVRQRLRRRGACAADRHTEGTATGAGKYSSEWVFSAPVFSGQEQVDSPFADTRGSHREMIGAVRLIMSRQTLANMRSEIVRSGLMVAAVLAALSLLVLFGITSAPYRADAQPVGRDATSAGRRTGCTRGARGHARGSRHAACLQHDDGSAAQSRTDDRAGT